MLNIEEIEIKTRSQLELQQEFLSNLMNLSALAAKLAKEFDLSPAYVMKIIMENLKN